MSRTLAVVGAIALLLLIGAVTLAAGREDRAMDSGETGQTTAAAACAANVLERANESRLAYSPRFCAAG
jgi:hypothetical protein